MRFVSILWLLLWFFRNTCCRIRCGIERRLCIQQGKFFNSTFARTAIAFFSFHTVLHSFVAVFSFNSTFARTAIAFFSFHAVLDSFVAVFSFNSTFASTAIAFFSFHAVLDSFVAVFSLDTTWRVPTAVAFFMAKFFI